MPRGPDSLGRDQWSQYSTVPIDCESKFSARPGERRFQMRSSRVWALQQQTLTTRCLDNPQPLLAWTTLNPPPAPVLLLPWMTMLRAQLMAAQVLTQARKTLRRKTPYRWIPPLQWQFTALKTYALASLCRTLQPPLCSTALLIRLALHSH